MSKQSDPYNLSGVDPDSPAGHKRYAITETSDDDGYHIDHVDEVSVVTLLKPQIVDAVEIEQLGQAIEQKLAHLSCPRVVVDLERVDHLSSAAIDMFLKLRLFSQNKGGSFCLCGVNDQLARIFKVTNLDSTLVVHENRRKATRALAKSR